MHAPSEAAQQRSAPIPLSTARAELLKTHTLSITQHCVDNLTQMNLSAWVQTHTGEATHAHLQPVVDHVARQHRCGRRPIARRVVCAARHLCTAKTLIRSTCTQTATTR